METVCYNTTANNQLLYFRGLYRIPFEGGPMGLYDQEIKRRRTFAIISHPDAGKTTLTEKFLLYGGAINSAGSVKARKTAKHAVSDWMEIEKQRGISVTSSVLQFEYDGYPRPPGFLRGYLPYVDGSRLRSHGHRRREGC